MKVLIGNVYQPTIEGGSITITRAMSDPVPTCTVHLRDNTSSIQIQAMQELLVLDDVTIPNPTANIAYDPSLLNIASNWNPETGLTGVTITQAGGNGGAIITINNAATSLYPEILQQQHLVTQGQIYTLSCYMQGSNTPTNVAGYLALVWSDFSGTVIGSSPAFTTTTPISTTLSRISVTGMVPAGAFIGGFDIGMLVTSSANSGTITITQVQFEANWLPTLTYPTPFCGPNQPNCTQYANSSFLATGALPSWIRQYRKFGGLITHSIAQDYHGNARTLQIDAVGYAWLLSTIIVNDAFTNKTDAQIINSLLAKYVQPTQTLQGTPITTTNVLTGVTLSNFGSNWDDLRTLFDNLAGISGFYWTIDAYWNLIYAPPGYLSMPISLICDNSSTPDNVTTFSAYNFSAEMDYTQPGSTILVIGSGSNVAEIIDGSTIAQNGAVSGYTMLSGLAFARKINDSTLQSVTDCTNRGMAELIQYDYPRNVYHLTTNQELIPGEGIAVTSNTDKLSKTVLLIQQVTATWIGTNEILTDEWEYVADLGATNRAVTNILSRLFRIANKNTSAPAISTTTLATIEKIGIADSAATGTTITGYAQTVLADTPSAYYRLGEIAGTIADDISGNSYQGTLNGGITEGAASLIHIDTAMTFDGSSGSVSLPPTFVPTGAHAWSLECWCEIAAYPANGTYTLVAMGNNATGQAARLQMKVISGFAAFLCSTVNGDISGGFIVIPNTTYHVVGTYDGTSTRLYVNGALVAGPSQFSLNLVANYARIAADGTVPADLFPGTIDEVGIYTTVLSPAQVYDHYTAGTTDSNYPSVVLADVPVAYYRLRELSGTAINDSSGNGYSGGVHGTITMGVTSLLRVNTAMTFSGSTGTDISLPTTFVPTGAHAWSLEAWMRITAIPGSNGAYGLCGMGNASTKEQGVIGMNVASGVASFFISGFAADFTGGTVAINTTYHVVGTYDGSNFRVYVNGTLTIGPSAVALNMVANFATIGANGFSLNFPGTIDEVAFYTYALSSTQISTHYAAGTS